jgi:hypothetical protein
MMYIKRMQNINLKYIYVMGYTKKKKYDKIKRCIVHKPRSIILSFLCRVDYNIFWIVTMWTYDIYHCVHIYFSEFF